MLKLLTFSIAIDFVLHPADTCLHYTDYTHTVGGSMWFVYQTGACVHMLCVYLHRAVCCWLSPYKWACVNWEL